MARFTTEFWVGLLAAVAIGLAAWGVLRTDDRPDGAGTYRVYVTVPSAEGIYADTPVRLAGVAVGSVDRVTLDGDRARLELVLQAAVKLPTDTRAELRSEGVLGDKYLRLVPGDADAVVAEGGELSAAEPGPDIDALTRKVALIADDVVDITGDVKGMTGDPTTQAQLRQTIANVEALSAELRGLAATNRADLDAVAANLREVSEALRLLVERSGGSVEAELETIRGITASLDRTAKSVEALAARVERGEGTVGRLLTDDATIDTIDRTLSDVSTAVSDVQELVSPVARFRTDVYYRGSAYFGTDPDEPGFTENPVAGRFRNVLGVTVGRRDDYWYLVEVVDHPVGVVSFEDHAIPDYGAAYREYVVKPSLRYSFMFAKRYRDLVFRFGLKESSGGVGVDALLAGDRVQLSADLYDFTYGSWPVMDRTPQLQLYARLSPLRRVYLETGADNVILGARHGYFTGFVGAGFSFNDQDLKYVLATLPL